MQYFFPGQTDWIHVGTYVICIIMVGLLKKCVKAVKVSVSKEVIVIRLNLHVEKTLAVLLSTVIDVYYHPDKKF